MKVFDFFYKCIKGNDFIKKFNSIKNLKFVKHYKRFQKQNFFRYLKNKFHKNAKRENKFNFMNITKMLFSSTIKEVVSTISLLVDYILFCPFISKLQIKNSKLYQQKNPTHVCQLLFTENGSS